MTFKTMSSHIKGLLPQASHQQIRDLTFKRMKAAAAAFALAFEEANKYEQQAMESVVHDWMKEVSKCADDPSYAPTTDARTMTAYEASYFSSLGHGIFWSYLCRKKACQFFGPNNAATWIQSKGRYWFRCPMCGYQHMPWADNDVVDVQAKRVLTITDPLTGNLMHIPCENPNSQDEKFIHNMIEVAARDIKTETDVQAWYSKSTGDVQKWLKNQSSCRSWEKFPYSAEKHVAYVDPKGWDATVQIERGWVMGSRLTAADTARVPFADFNGLVSVFANYVAASKAMSLAAKM